MLGSRTGIITSDFNKLVGELLVIAGGGGSGSSGPGTRAAGGGGAGGLIYNNYYLFTIGKTYNVTIGTGGNAGVGTSPTPGTNGNNTIFDVLTAIGGGRGGVQSGTESIWCGASGGSGGGGANSYLTTSFGGTSTAGQGYNGGQGVLNAPDGGAGGGGGGAGGIGQNGDNTTGGGNGGIGMSISITGSSITYATGGRGGDRLGPTAGQAGAANTGNGARGSDGTVYIVSPPNVLPGAAGGSGIVILAILTSSNVTLTSTGTLVYNKNTSSRPGYDVYKITSGTGTIQLS